MLYESRRGCETKQEEDHLKVSGENPEVYKREMSIGEKQVPGISWGLAQPRAGSAPGSGQPLGLMQAGDAQMESEMMGESWAGKNDPCALG